jgi:hypothetical protein
MMPLVSGFLTMAKERQQQMLPKEAVTSGAIGAVTLGNIGIGDLYEVPPGFNYKFSGIVDEVVIFKTAIAEADIVDIMTDGLGKFLGLAAVSNAGKLTTTWGDLKQQ